MDAYRETEMIQTALRRPSIPKLRKGGTQLCERDSKQLRASGSKSLCVVKNVVLGGHAQVAQRKACIELYMCTCMAVPSMFCMYCETSVFEGGRMRPAL